MFIVNSILLNFFIWLSIQADRRNRYGGHMARFCQACCEKGYLCSLDRYRRCPSDDLSDSGFLEDYSSPCEAERGFYRHRSPVTEHASGEMEPLDVIRNKRRREWSSVDSDDEFDRRENARCSSNASDHDDNRSDGLIHLARMDLRRLLDYRRRNTRTERQPLACRRYRPYWWRWNSIWSTTIYADHNRYTFFSSFFF